MNEVVTNKYEEIKETLWDNKLDENELNFLKNQKSLALSLKDDSEKKLYKDILYANIKENNKNKKLLWWYIDNID